MEEPKRLQVQVDLFGMMPIPGAQPQGNEESGSKTVPSKWVNVDFSKGLTPEIMALLIQDIKEKDEALTEVPLDLYSMGPWSSSKLKSLQKCPFQYYLKYVLKLKVPDELKAHDDPLSANVGKAAHSVLEHVMVGKPVEKAYAKAKKDHVNPSGLNEGEWNTHVVPLEYNINSFKDRIEALARVNPIARVFAEVRIAITKDYEPTGFFSDDAWVRGVIDLVLLLENGDIIIIDHKTGGGEGSPNVYKSQLDWYKVLFHHGIQSVVGAQTGVHFIKAGEVKMVDYTPAKDIENNLSNMLEMSIEGAIDTLKAKGFFKHVRGSYCKWCEYDQIGCKSGEFKPLELATKKWIQIKPV